MSTINSLMNSSLNSASQTTSGSSSTTLSSLKSQISSIKSDTSLTSEQKQAKLSELNSKLTSASSDSSASSASSSTSSSTGKAVIRKASSMSSSLSTMIGGFNSDLMNSMLGSDSGFTSSSVSNFFFSSGKTLGSIMTSYQSSLSVQNQARSLSSEIALDKARGVDTSDKQEKLSNLTANISLMNASLKSDVNSALEDKVENEEVVSVIDGIKASLEQYEKDAKAFVEKKYGTTDTTSAEE